MTGEQIIAFGFDQTGTNENDVSTANKRLYLNLAYIDVINEMVKMKVSYMWDTGITDAVAGQSEYLIEKLGIDPDALAIKNVREIYVKYSADDVYPTKVGRINPTNLEYHPDYYAANQYKGDPFFYIADNSFFLYPAPTETVTDGIEIFVTHNPPEIDETSTADDIQTPLSLHKAIAYKMREYILDNQKDFNGSELANRKYKREIREMKPILKERTTMRLQEQTIVPNKFR